MTLSRNQRFALGRKGRTGGNFKLSPVSGVESFVWSVVPVSTPAYKVVRAIGLAEVVTASSGRVPSVEMVRGWVSDVV
jgi:hypothetical protein